MAFVQVKSEADQNTFEKYVKSFENRRENFDRLIFAVHSPKGALELPDDPGYPIHLWTSKKIAELVVRLGLGEWVERRLA